MLGTSNPTGFIFKPKLSKLNLQSSSTTWFSELSKEMISLSHLSYLLLRSSSSYSQCSITVQLVQTSSHKTVHILALITSWQKTVFNPSQLADPSASTANQGFTCQVFSHSTIPAREGKQSLNLSRKVVSSGVSLLLVSLLKTELEEGRLQSDCK